MNKFTSQKHSDFHIVVLLMIITKEDVRNKLPGAVNHQPGLGHLQLFFGASPVDNGKACLVPAMVLSPGY